MSKMMNRFKRRGLKISISETGLDMKACASGHTQKEKDENANNLPTKRPPSRQRRFSLQRNKGQSSILPVTEVQKIRKYFYGRPHFLKLLTLDEIAVTCDHIVRPIIVPRDLSLMPWELGYAETINSGKSKHNEDQARIHFSSIKAKVSVTEDELYQIRQDYNGQLPPDFVPTREVSIPYYIFALFDGHAGEGCACVAASKLHLVIHEKLQEISQHLAHDGDRFLESVGAPENHPRNKKVYWYPQISVTKEGLIVGALESAFNEMDEKIRVENLQFDGANGGCTVVLCLFILGKVYTANAGDSRAIFCSRDYEPMPLSHDFTPETERSRIRYLAHNHPELMGGHFTSNEYVRQPIKSDIGKKIMYRAPYMTGWGYKTVTQDDLKSPVVFGYGKRSRVMARIGVTRGLGDHELCAHNTKLKIKPFMSSQPEVNILELIDNMDEDSVIIMGTDGLWDVTPNKVASKIVFSTLDDFPQDDKERFRYRYVSAAQDLVMHARGKFNDRHWRMADGCRGTIDDVSVFVIPVVPYRKEWLRQNAKVHFDDNCNVEFGTEPLLTPSLKNLHMTVDTPIPDENYVGVPVPDKSSIVENKIAPPKPPRNKNLLASVQDNTFPVRDEAIPVPEKIPFPRQTLPIPDKNCVETEPEPVTQNKSSMEIPLPDKIAFASSVQNFTVEIPDKIRHLHSCEDENCCLQIEEEIVSMDGISLDENCNHSTTSIMEIRPLESHEISGDILEDIVTASVNEVEWSSQFRK